MVLLIALAAAVHAWLLRGVPNTPAGMLVFHGTAALADLALLYATPAVISGHVARDTQALLLVSIIANAAGWVLYMAYVSPVYYNGFMWGLSVAQAIRLLMVSDDGLGRLGMSLVRHRHRVCDYLHIGKGLA